MPDREKVIKALEYCILKETSCRGCPYEEKECTRTLKSDVLSLLKEQEAKIEQLNRFVNGFSRDAMPVVRCKDCKYWSAERINDYNKCRRWIKVGVKNFATTGDWFCADGERKEGK